MDVITTLVILTAIVLIIIFLVPVIEITVASVLIVTVLVVGTVILVNATRREHYKDAALYASTTYYPPAGGYGCEMLGDNVFAGRPDYDRAY
jgi:hypothetical protein